MNRVRAQKRLRNILQMNDHGSASSIAILSTLGATVLIFIICVMIGVGYSNSEIEIRNQSEAQQKANEAVKDKTWKVVKQKAGILDKYATDFQKAFGGIMAERYQGEASGAPMFKWIKEHNPEYSTEMYKDLSDAVEANQTEFLNVQKRLIDIKREHMNLLKKFPSKLVVGNRDTLIIVIVTSTTTKKVFETGIDDDVDLFDGDPNK